ncbi:hypothetical protein OSSY52_16670 [Tepiditoga spiralis]|uniref:Metalloprotease TldD/E C-terminal domain-containing protein n=1 Tax=Tepiditoga spiralis TaxID=2108365 RepID=A0A7G1G807_9BACT|nr:metallopeptidase TldD-related protein [Tepiditoga spiralis]BBE31526.1 hypothetical protein OSSY52_16670 [Tepiditoga spiralis]
MIDKIKNILNSYNEIKDWKIIEKNSSSKELFFIRKELDMNRATKTHEIILTIYRDFEENEKKYKGHSTTNIHPTMTEEEIKTNIEDAYFSAKFVKNEYYPLAMPKENKNTLSNKFNEKSMEEWIPILTKEIFKNDKYKDGWINSAELFLTKNKIRLLNSNGIDVEYEKYDGMLEFIVNWKGNEEIELFEIINFSDYVEDFISSKIKEKFEIAKYRAIAQSTPSVKDIPVLLTGSSVRNLFDYYVEQSNAAMVYQQYSNFKVGESIQGDKINGDKINITLDPLMKNSTRANLYDEDGIPLEKVELIKNGKLKRYSGNLRYSHYLNIEPTGNINNVVVECGNKTLDELKKEPHLELIEFSGFDVDTLTGDFGSEIRFGWYYDGKNKLPITGGSISGNLKEVQNEMYLSKEYQQINNFIGPKSIKIFNVSISG